MLTSVTSFIKRKVFRRDRDRWNHQYAHGKWAGLGALDELSRFSVIVGYAQHLKPGGTILELGAGEGVLQQRFNRDLYTQYVATDVSDVAIAQAKRFEDNKTRFAVADMNAYVPDQAFDVIIINEAIYYGGTVQRILDRYAAYLKPDGIFIVSINYDNGRNDTWHRQLESCSYAKLDRTVISTSKNTFYVTVLQQNPHADTASATVLAAATL